MTYITRHLRELRLIGGSLIILALVFGLHNTASAGKSGFLGVYLGDKVTIIVEKGNKSEDFKGVSVEGIVDDSPASKAGMLKDDVILKFNGVAINSTDQLRELILDTSPGEKVEVVVHREGKQEKLKVVMGEQEGESFSGWIGDDGRLFNLQKYVTALSANRPWLGIEMQSLSDQLKEYFKVEGKGGILVAEVVEDSPAAKAGLKAGDVIVEMDDEAIAKQSDVIKVLEDHEIGDEITVNVLRDGKNKSVKATLAENPKKDEGIGYWINGDDNRILDLKNPKYLEGLKIYGDALKLDEEDLQDLEEQLKDMKLDFGGDMDKLNVEMDQLRKELEILREEVKKK